MGWLCGAKSHGHLRWTGYQKACFFFSPPRAMLPGLIHSLFKAAGDTQTRLKLDSKP